MSEVKKVKLNTEEITQAYKEIKDACIRQNTSTDSISILKRYFSGPEPLLDINEPIPGEKGWTPIFLSTFFKRNEETKCLLSLGAKPDVEIGQDKITPLHIAATNGAAIICKYYLNYGMNVDHQTAKLITPLMRACEGGSYDTVNTLINSKPNIKLKDIDNNDCIFYAEKNNHSNLIRFIQYSFLSKELMDSKDSRRSVGKI